MDMDISNDFGSVSKRISSGLELRAHQHPFVNTLLNHHASRLSELAGGLGSPLHVVLPQIFTENLRQMQEVFAKSGVTGALLFAKKANKADCFVRVCAEQGVGVDVASSGELAKALAAGITGSVIGVSGPDKNDRLLSESLHHACLIAIDSIQELQRLLALATRLNTQARVLLRQRVAIQSDSRFGLAPQELEQALSICQQYFFAIKLEGFSFHISGYSVEERAQCASEAIDWCLQARTRGLTACRRVDMGGGLPVQYVAPAQWSAFLQQNRRDHYHANKTFGGFYPYGSELSGAQALKALLDSPVQGSESLASQARENDIELIVEPGRALLNQAGFSLFEVIGVKDRCADQGYAIVTVQGSSLSLSEQWFNSEYLPDPMLLEAHSNVGGIRFPACVGGSTCLESDMITWRKVGFPRAVEPGDRLVYLNTAGYQMDSNESPFHEAQLPTKVVVWLEANETLRWRLDGL